MNEYKDYQLTNSEPARVYAGAPIEEVKALNKSASNEYNINREVTNAAQSYLKNLDIESRNKHIKDRAYNQYTGALNNTIEGGDYQNLRYKLTDIINTYKNDKELQGALKSRQAEKEYISELQDRYEAGNQNISQTETEGSKNNKEVTKRKGGINKEQYLYALQRSKEDNFNPLKYNSETGLIENSYVGHNIVDDKSKEIFDEMDKRIQGWKAETITTNGNTYKSNPATGGYINFETGEKVDKTEVQDALKQELSNRGDLKDFLNQEKEIIKYKETNGTNEVTPELLKKKGFSNEEIKGMTDLGLNLNNIYDKIEDDKQLNKYTNPGSDKASYTQSKNDFKVNELLIKEIEHKNREREKKLEQPAIDFSNHSITETIGKPEMDNLNKSASDTQNRIKEIENTYGTKMPPDIQNEYKSLKGDLEYYNNQSKELYTGMSKKGFDVYKTAEETLFNTKDGFFTGRNKEEKFSQYRDLYKFLISNPNTASLPIVKDLSSFNINGNSTVITDPRNPSSSIFNDNQKLDRIENFIKTIKETGISNIPVLKQALNSYTDYVLQSSPDNNTSSIGVLQSNLNKTVDKYVENNDKIQYSYNTTLLSSTGDKKNIIDNANIAVKNSLLSGTDFKESGDKSIQSVLEEYNKNQEEDKDKIKIDDINVSISTKPLTKGWGVNVSFPNGTSKIMYPHDQDSYRTMIKQVAERLRGSENPVNIQKANEIDGQLNFGDLRKKKSSLYTKDIGESIPIDLPTETTKNGIFISTNSIAKNQKFGLKVMSKNSDGSPNFSLVDGKGNPDNFNIVFNTIGSKNEFNSIDDFINHLEAINISK